MNSKPRLRVASKWKKWKIIQGDIRLADRQPVTYLYAPEKLEELLQRFSTVFVKPDGGWGGKYVMRIQRHSWNLQVLFEERSLMFSDITKFHAWFRRISRGKLFIIQQGIDLIPLKTSPVDLRTIIHKNETGQWEVVGMFAKIAKKGMAVTNVKAEGKAFQVEKYFSGIGMNRLQQKEIIEEMKDFSLKIGEVFGKHYNNNRYGIDLGLDREGRLWLIEINTRPSISILWGINKKMYRRGYNLRDLLG